MTITLKSYHITLLIIHLIYIYTTTHINEILCNAQEKELVILLINIPSLGKEMFKSVLPNALNFIILRTIRAIE